MQKFSRVIVRAGRIAEVLLGLVFLASALLKARDINLFVVQISHYGVIHGAVVLRSAALLTLAVETAAGVALVFGWRFRGVLYGAVLALLGVFTGLIVYGWIFNNLKDCGCFGKIEVSPGVSIAKNVLLALLCGLAWATSNFRFWILDFRRAPQSKIQNPKSKIQDWLDIRRWLPGVICLIAALLMPAYALPHLEKMHQKTRPFAQFVFEQDGVAYDLGKGQYFVAMLNTTCEHCMASVATLNDLAAIPDFPSVVGICYEERAGALDEFREITSPEFPLFSLGNQVLTFYSLLGPNLPPPRFYLIRDGESVRFWDENVPDANEVLALAESRP